MAQHYLLRCLHCGQKFSDDGFMLDCPGDHGPGLLVTEYTSTHLQVDPLARGISRYRCWLPVRRDLTPIARPAIYQSEKLSRIAGLPNLWIAFNGYWPEKGALLETATFKELEAYGVLGRFPQGCKKVPVMASAGNTGAAFAHYCSKNQIPCLIIVPEKGVKRLNFARPLHACVKIVVLTESADYYDAILLAQRLSKEEGFFPEGGVKNVGRRDGIGTTLLSAVETVGRLPDYYFQAIGSGTGAIATHEMAGRLVDDGRFGQKRPRLMLSQNLPFAPIHKTWRSMQPELWPLAWIEKNRKYVHEIVADVLSNPYPPYLIKGGVYDILTESGGDMLAAGNLEASQAMSLFEESEGVDIEPAAGVALATLLRAVKQGRIDSHAYILLHITGGGCHYREKLGASFIPTPATLSIRRQEATREEAVARITALFHH